MRKTRQAYFENNQIGNIHWQYLQKHKTYIGNNVKIP